MLEYNPRESYFGVRQLQCAFPGWFLQVDGKKGKHFAGA
jgi:hypothetical protein